LYNYQKRGTKGKLAHRREGYIEVEVGPSKQGTRTKGGQFIGVEKDDRLDGHRGRMTEEK
jgi:hypothetical protein